MSTRFLFQIVGLVVVVWLLTIVGRVIGSFSGYPYVSLAEVVSGTRLAPSKQATGNRSLQDKTDHQGSSSQTISDEHALANDGGVSPQGAYTNQAEDRSAAERPNLSDAVPGNTVVFNGQTARQTEQQERHHDQPANVSQNTAATSDDYGKQAALDSLLAVNYDEQHPVGSAAADHAPTQIISGAEAPTQMIAGESPSIKHGIHENLPTRQIRTPQNAATQVIQEQQPQAAPTQQLNSSAAADKTEFISDSKSQRKIRRDQRPDAGGTQVFEKQ